MLYRHRCRKCMYLPCAHIVRTWAANRHTTKPHQFLTLLSFVFVLVVRHYEATLMCFLRHVPQAILIVDRFERFIGAVTWACVRSQSGLPPSSLLLGAGRNGFSGRCPSLFIL